MKESEKPWHTRLAVYDHFIERGNAPTVDDLVQRTGFAADTVRKSLETLAAHHQIVLAPASPDDVWMAHPFSGIPTDFAVHSRDRSYWANCAWDVFGIAALLNDDCRVVMRCAETGETEEIHIRPAREVTAPGIVHFLVPARDFWKDVAFT